MFPQPSVKSQPDLAPKNRPSQSQDFKIPAVSAKNSKSIEMLLLKQGNIR